MCLLVTVELTGVDPKHAAAIASHCSENHDLAVTAKRSRKHSSASLFTIAGKAEGCACSLLADDADWNAATWSLRADVPHKLAGVVRCLLGRARGDVSFAAAWIGEEPFEATISSGDLLNTIEGGAVATKTRYTIRW
jgi:hypothetical protein